jgi:hypothetical protein
MTKVSGQDLGILGTDNPQLAQQSYGSTVNRQYEYANPVDHNNTHTNAILTASTIQEALAFAISTPGDPVGQFYDICMHRPGYDDWKTRHVTLDEAIRAGRISREWADMRAKQWGVDSALYLNRVLGEFADNSEDGIIPLSHIRTAVERWKEWVGGGRHEISGKRVMGVDTARSGEDKTVIAVGIAYRLQEIYSFAKLSVTSVAGNVTRLAQGHEIHIETDGGLGAGVYDVLRDDGLPNLRPITVSGATTFRDKSKQLKFLNVRAAMWWNMREMLDPQYGVECMLPPHEGLILDLSTPRYTIERDAVVKLESKDSIRKRLGRSTDYGDAACLMFWTAGRGGGVVF